TFERFFDRLAPLVRSAARWTASSASAALPLETVAPNGLYLGMIEHDNPGARTGRMPSPHPASGGHAHQPTSGWNNLQAPEQARRARRHCPKVHDPCKL